jgi:alpha-ketoglutarate-dependent taurine dioxygenase
MNRLLDELSTAGWMKVPSSESILQFASNLGQPVPSRRNGSIVDVLEVTKSEEGKRNSFTGRYGDGEFPFHTDGAHLTVVPKFLVLRLIYPTESNRPTRLCDPLQNLSQRQRTILEREQWKFTDGRRSFYSPILSDAGFRFDSNIMAPLSAEPKAAMIIEESIKTSNTIDIDWEQGFMVVIDNHRMLHSRANAPKGTEVPRKLERVMVTTI